MRGRGPERAVLSSNPLGNCLLLVKFYPKITVRNCSAVRLNVVPGSKLRFTCQWMLHIVSYRTVDVAIALSGTGTCGSEVTSLGFLPTFGPI